MRDDFDPEPEMDADSLDYEQTFHMSILDKLPPITPYNWSQVASGPLVVHRGSLWDAPVGNEKAKATEYWERLQSPQSMPPRQGSAVCPSPTALPYRFNPASQPGCHVAMVSIESCFVHRYGFSQPPAYHGLWDGRSALHPREL